MRMISGKPARLAALMRTGVGGGQFPLQSIGTASMVLTSFSDTAIVAKSRPLSRSISAATLEVWIRESWICPDCTTPERSFTDMDLARANLIRDLKTNMG